MKQVVKVYRLNGQWETELDGTGKEARNKAIERAKTGVEFGKPETKLIAENFPEVKLPTIEELLIEVRHAEQAWLEEEDKDLFKTLKRMEGMLEVIREAEY